jgi:hypothetical protein
MGSLSPTEGIFNLFLTPRTLVINIFNK